MQFIAISSFINSTLLISVLQYHSIPTSDTLKTWPFQKAQCCLDLTKKRCSNYIIRNIPPLSESNIESSVGQVLVDSSSPWNVSSSRVIVRFLLCPKPQPGNSSNEDTYSSSIRSNTGRSLRSYLPYATGCGTERILWLIHQRQTEGLRGRC